MTPSSAPIRALRRVLAAAIALGLSAPLPARADDPPKVESKAKQARLKTYAAPDFPEEAKKKNLSGNVVLEIVIEKTGAVSSAKVIESAWAGFEQPAVDAAKKLVFDPATDEEGRPVSSRRLFRYTFSLQEDAKPGEAPAEQRVKTGLKGVVLVSGADVPIVGAQVKLTPKAGGGAQTMKVGEDGAFAFVDIPAGTYRASVTATGFQDLELDEEVTAGELVGVKYRLSPVGTLEVQVRGARPPREVTKREVSQREISRIPGTNGDALRSLQNLPGVARAPGLAGVLLVRGSAPQDTQIFVDGTPVPIIYHFGGLSSVIPTEMLEKIDFYPGNFSAQYGRAQGGIVDVALKSPPKEWHGLLQVDNIDVRALVQGPIPGVKGWTFSAAGRRSYLDAWFPTVLQALGAGATQAPVYYDYQFVIEGKPNPDATFRASFFGSDDALKLLLGEPSPGEPALSGNLGFATSFQRLQLRYEHQLTPTDKLRLTAAGGRDNITVGIGNLYFKLESSNLTGRAEYSKQLGKGATLNVGIDMFLGVATVRARLPSLPPPGQPAGQPFSTRPPVESQSQGELYYPGAYAELEFVPDKRARIVPGVRVDYFNTTKRTEISPRISARYDIMTGFPRTTVKGGVGVFQQPPEPRQALPPLGSTGLRANRAIHYSVGLEQEITKQIELGGEFFFKQLDSQVSEALTTSVNTVVTSNVGSGYVVGGEFLARYKADERFFGWLAYTLSRSVRSDYPGGPERQVGFDQTHILTALGSVRLGSGWELGARFRLVSGNLVTPNVCNPFDSGCDPNRVNALFHAASGAYTPVPVGGPASERLPVFHQLDIRIDKRWKFKAWAFSVYLDVLNVYNNQNVEGLGYNFDFTSRQYVSGLPIFPQLGMRGEF